MDKTIKIPIELYKKVKMFGKFTNRNLRLSLKFLIESNPHFEFLNNITPQKVKEFNKFNPKEAVK